MGALSGLSANTGNSAIAGVVSAVLELPTTGLVSAWGTSRLVGNPSDPVIRVRRSSDNTEQDFTEGQILAGSHTAFVGSGDGDIVSIYEQSANNNTINRQNGAGNFITAGIVNNINGYPFPYNGLNDANYAFDSTIGIGTVRSLYFVIRLDQDPPNGVGGLIGQDTGTQTNPNSHIFVRRRNDYSISIDGGASETGKAAINGGAFVAGANVAASGQTNYPLTSTILSVVWDSLNSGSLNQIGSINTSQVAEYGFPGRIAAVVLYSVDTTTNGTHNQILSLLNSRFGVF